MRLEADDRLIWSYHRGLAERNGLIPLDVSQLALDTGFPFETAALLLLNGVPADYIIANCDRNEYGVKLYKMNPHIPFDLYRRWILAQFSYPDEYLREMFISKL